MRTLIITIAAVIVALPATAQVPSVPAVVQAALGEAVAQCDDEIVLEKGFIKQQDVNGDGVADFILDFNHYRCGGTRLNCGSGGCTLQVFASLNGRHVKVIEDLVQAFRFGQIKGRPAVALGEHGSNCGRAGSERCAKVLYWNGFRFDPSN